MCLRDGIGQSVPVNYFAFCCSRSPDEHIPWQFCIMLLLLLLCKGGRGGPVPSGVCTQRIRLHLFEKVGSGAPQGTLNGSTPDAQQLQMDKRTGAYSDH